MQRKLIAPLLGLTDLLIALGAFGHSFMGRKTLDAGLAQLSLDPHTHKLIYLVWYFCGGCMLVFGLLVIGSAWRGWRGEQRSLMVAQLIGIFYVLVGVLALAYMREAFWSVFVILGGLTLIFSFILRKTERSAA
ncbi:MAG: hypothetical protein KGJ04_04335 [Gammaproteobacteria bacterium]|nr:hypothetical protein [Gammaproteobacteria bacterium]